jgi:hypothetical protein
VKEREGVGLRWSSGADEEEEKKEKGVRRLAAKSAKKHSRWKGSRPIEKTENWVTASHEDEAKSWQMHRESAS